MSKISTPLVYFQGLKNPPQGGGEIWYIAIIIMIIKKPATTSYLRTPLFLIATLLIFIGCARGTDVAGPKATGGISNDDVGIFQAHEKNLTEWVDSQKDLFDYLAQSPETYNRVSLLHLGTASRPKRLELIREAQKFILMKMPYWFDDQSGQEHIQALRDKRQENPNIDMKIMLDFLSFVQAGDFFPKSKIKKELKKVTNNQVELWNKLTWQRSFSFSLTNARMHDKVFIVDGKKLIIGGMNIADDYMLGGSSRVGWHDTDLLIEGPAVTEATRCFLIGWELAKLFKGPTYFPPSKSEMTKLLKDIYWENQQKNYFQVLDRVRNKPTLVTREVYVPFLDNYPDYYPTFGSVAKENFLTPMRLIYDDSIVDNDEDNGKPLSKIALIARELLNQSKKTVRAIIPYMTLTTSMRNTFASAAQRGVNIEIITNSLDSHDLGDNAYYGSALDMLELLKAGVKIYEWAGHKPLEDLEKQYDCTMDDSEWYGRTIHTKGISFDKQILVLGSHNFNIRSEKLNSEIGALMKDKSVALEFESIFENDLDRDPTQRVVKCGSKFLERPRKVRQLDLKEFEAFVEKNMSKIKLLRHFRKFM